MEVRLSQWLLIFCGLSAIYYAMQQGVIYIEMVLDYVTYFIMLGNSQAFVNA